MSRNPYENVEGAPQLRRSVFVFMDILGYENLTRVAELDRTQQELLQRLHSALSNGRKDLEEKHEGLAVLKKLTTKDRYALKAFTDNIVIAWPIIDDAEVELGSAFSKVAWFQFKMALEGFFIRGAISIGETYVDDIVVFGDALTQAHTGESRRARDPRIIFDGIGGEFRQATSSLLLVIQVRTSSERTATGFGRPMVRQLSRYYPYRGG